MARYRIDVLRPQPALLCLNQEHPIHHHFQHDVKASLMSFMLCTQGPSNRGCGVLHPQTFGVSTNSGKIGSLHRQNQIISKELKAT